MNSELFKKPRILDREAIKIVGIHKSMSLAENKTQALWQTFGPRKKEIANKVDMGNYSIQVYDADFLSKPFLPTTTFVKWAGVAVSDFSNIPDQMETLEIPAGNWAVFTYKGKAEDFRFLMQYVMTQWLPSSEYRLDSRPHFEYIDQSYRDIADPTFQEEFWLPIVQK